MADILIRGGTVIDGTGAAAYPADVPVARVVKIDRDRGDLDPDVFVEPLQSLKFSASSLKREPGLNLES